MKLTNEEKVTIIGSVLSLLGASIILPSIYEQVVKPIIIIDLQENLNGTESEFSSFDIEVQNLGLTAATNFSLIIDSATSIYSIKNIFSTTDVMVSYPQISDSQLIPKQNATIIGVPVTILNTFDLVNGDGSTINLQVNTNKSKSDLKRDDIFKVYATYDQGSKKGYFDTNPQFSYIIEIWEKLTMNYLPYIIVGILLIAIPLVLYWIVHQFWPTNRSVSTPPNFCKNCSTKVSNAGAFCGNCGKQL